MSGDMKPASVVIASEHLAAEISCRGAQPTPLQNRDGEDLLRNGWGLLLARDTNIKFAIEIGLIEA